MIEAVAFDVYGTLIDTDAAVASLRPVFGEHAVQASRTWRQKQLEYSFRRALMGLPGDFAECTRDALVYAFRENALEPTDEQLQTLLQAHAALPPYDGVDSALSRIGQAGLRRIAFSNGSLAAIDAVLARNGLGGYFDDRVSVEAVGSFKPAPVVYAHLLQRCQLPAQQVCLVSGNPFDIIGAGHCGLHAVWVRRHPAVPFDAWGHPPTRTVESLDALPDALASIR